MIRSCFKRFFCYVGIIVFACLVTGCYFNSNDKEHRCFCKLNGEVDDCGCAIDIVHKFNQLKIFPRISSLHAHPYFRYFKVNLQRVCPFWPDDSQCSLQDCHVKGCGDDEIPEGLKNDKEIVQHEKKKYIEQEQSCSDENYGGLGTLDPSISEESQEAINKWTLHDDQQDNFCELDDDKSDQIQYVDLMKNPERYTGYRGRSAHRIWNSIYNENCFSKPMLGFGENLNDADLFERDANQCLEKRIFYRLISGLHTSINLHLCKNYLMKDVDKFGMGRQVWGPNVTEFLIRFDPEFDQEGPQRLKNLYVTYLIELRALAKAAPYLKSELFFTGNTQQDQETRAAIKDILNTITSFPHHFDESLLFRGDPLQAQALKQEFRRHFRNISRIMDCVGCDKCKLWGKLQVQGMGTALKILFSGETIGPGSTIEPGQKTNFQLRRTEMVALVNAFSRLSSSIHSLDLFRDLLRTK